MTARRVTPVRGRVYWADVGYGEKPWLCVSNNGRNAALDDFLAVRMTTTTDKPRLPTIVPTTPADPLAGLVLCDDLVQLFRDEVTRDGGALTPRTMTSVAGALRAALAF